MINKRKLHHLWTTKIRPVSPWFLLVLCVLSAAVSIYALRSNNLKMIQLREAVARADEQNGDVEKALRDLREHVHAHMNTNLASGQGAIRPPIQLKHRYDRLAKAEKERAAAKNGQIYTDAQAHCERQVPTGLSGGGRVPCIEQYVTQHGGVKAKPIPDDLYKFDFVSPTWSPDLAGWSLVATAVFGLLFLFRWGMERLVRSQL